MMFAVRGRGVAQQGLTLRLSLIMTLGWHRSQTPLSSCAVLCVL